MIEAIIFDMDGVIADSEPLHIKAEKKTLAPFNTKFSKEESQKYMGKSTKLLLENFIKKYSLNIELDTLYVAHKKNLLELYKNEVKPINGAIELINWVVKKNLKIALASSSDFDLINAVITNFNLVNIFKTIVSGEDVENFKPAPEIFYKAAHRLSVKTENCLVIEDTTAGVNAAKSAGMYCIGFKSPNSPNQDLSSADLVINDLYILLRKLNNQGLEDIIPS